MNEITSRIVLASASSARRMLLENAGVPALADPANVDEDGVKDALKAQGASARDVADTLAELKALTVSNRHPGAFVIGGDQTLDCEGQWFDKPVGRAGAVGHLRALSGRTHSLQSAVCVARDGAILWRHVGIARLTMRPLTEDFMNWYLESAGEDILGSVGAYRLEGLGAQLFQSVEGDYFTVLGLPLLPLLDFLRRHEVIPS